MIFCNKKCRRITRQPISIHNLLIVLEGFFHLGLRKTIFDPANLCIASNRSESPATLPVLAVLPLDGPF